MINKLIANIKKTNAPIVVGLDPTLALIPEHVLEKNYKEYGANLEGVAKAIEWSRETPREEVVARMEKIITERDPNESTETVKFWKSFGVANEGGVIQEKEMQMWVDWLVQNGDLKEGQLQVTDLYTNEFNPYAK